MSPDSNDLAAGFQRFAAWECAGKSPLYHALSHGIAEDRRVLSLCRAAGPGQPAPNLLLAAVHFLLRRAPEHPLAGFYPDLTSHLGPPEGAFDCFRDFCAARRDQIVALMARRVVSTNEVARCCALTLAFREAAEALGAGAFHFLEIGASAGLNLLWDHYRYEFGPMGQLGPPEAELTLDCRLTGIKQYSLIGPGPLVRSRKGVDLHPLDPAEPDDRDWLMALVWPELTERAARLEGALGLAARQAARTEAGDGIAFFPAYATALPAGEALCVYHSFTFNQIDRESATTFEAALTEASHGRPVARVAMEWGDQSAPSLDLTLYRAGRPERRRLAFCDPYGDWIEWLL